MWGGPVIYPAQEPFLQIWDGVPGTGKSYCLAYNQVEWRLAGHPVVTNLKIRAMPFLWFRRKKRMAEWGEYVYLQDSDFECDQDTEPRFIQILNEVKARNPGKHILCVIDEAPDFYPQEDSRTLSKPLKMWVRKHRHQDISLVLTAQSYDMIATVFRKLAKRYRIHKNLVGDPVLEKLLWWFGDNFHMAYSVTASRGKPVGKDIFDRRYYLIRGKSVGAFYDTTQMHGSGNLQGGIRKAKRKLGRVLCGLLFFTVCFFAFKLIWGIITPDYQRPEKVQAVRVAKVPTENYLIDVVEKRGDSILMELVSDSGLRRYEVVPYRSADQFFELSDQVGETSALPVRKVPAVGEIFLERGR